ncbi:MAG: GDSL-type esterase/lipase family protein [Proteobacteria bacterium]|nr:GDSL-type esterase/lipase family protein [Pseudomonadota bacterium]MDA1299483.1 GDSL-type esterase/lipase family protein [Pseudomonadota bacterium]
MAIFMLLPLAGTTATHYPDTDRWLSTIERFEAAERAEPPPRGAIVATGSSSMLYWRDRIQTDLAPLTIIPRGFGGSNMYDLRYFLPELVLRHEPRAVMIYEGDNDIALGASPEQVLLHFAAIVEELHLKLPGTRVYILAIKPSVSRWHLWPQMHETNERFRAFSAADPLVTYVDVATPMIEWDGEAADDTSDKVRKVSSDLFVGDMLHMNSKGYDVWRDAVRPVLIPAESKFE